jgi:hypothetical protein
MENGKLGIMTLHNYAAQSLKSPSTSKIKLPA